MSSTRQIAIGVATMLTAATVFAQVIQAPKELSGRWTFAPANRSNSFSLDDIAAAPDGSFTAKLTWWTTDPKCAVRNEAISGRMTATGLTFDARTKCDVDFTAVLNRSENEWVGQATTKGANAATVEMKAK